jgi:N-acetylglucosamine-6-sulfatase
MGRAVRLSVSLAITMLLASVVVFLTAIGFVRSGAAAERPNILFVMTDDQPTGTMMAMLQVSGRVRDMGMSLPNAYVSESLCCPSRASILRGQYPHNTGVVTNGGLQTFRARGEEDDTVAHWLGRQGYSTALLVGKYMNGYDASYRPPGWSYWYAKADAPTSGKKVNDNGHVVDFAGKPGNWGDRFKASAMGYLDRSTNQASDKPFALCFWTGQPHLPADNYADRYADMYAKAALNPNPSFDEGDVSGKPAPMPCS